MKFYRNAAGQYLLTTDGPPPPGGIEVPVPPQNAAAVWNGSAWVEPSRTRWRVLKSTFTNRMTPAEATQYRAVLNSLSDKDFVVWDAVRWIWSDEPRVIAMATSVGWTTQRIAELLAYDPDPEVQ